MITNVIHWPSMREKIFGTILIDLTLPEEARYSYRLSALTRPHGPLYIVLGDLLSYDSYFIY